MHILPTSGTVSTRLKVTEIADDFFCNSKQKRNEKRTSTYLNSVHFKTGRIRVYINALHSWLSEYRISVDETDLEI